MGYLYHVYTRKAQKMSQKYQRKFMKARRWEVVLQTLSSCCDKEDILRNSQRCGYQHKIEPVNIPVMIGDRLRRPHPQLRATGSWLLLGKGGRDGCFQGRGPSQVAYTQWMDDPTSVSTLAALVGFSWLFLKSKKRRGHEGGEEIC